VRARGCHHEASPNEPSQSHSSLPANAVSVANIPIADANIPIADVAMSNLQSAPSNFSPPIDGTGLDSFSYASKAIKLPHPLADNTKQIDDDLRTAMEWESRRPPGHAMQERDQIMTSIEKRAEKLRISGEHQKWVRRVDPDAGPLVSDISRTLLCELLEEVGEDAAPLRRDLSGFPMVGTIPGSGRGTPVENAQPILDRPTLESEMRSRNEQLLSTLHQDKHSEFLFDDMQKDWKLHRMTEPVPVAEVNLDRCLLSRRFSREQGLKPDGSLRLRAVDDETSSGTNEAAAAGEQFHHDHLDALVQLVILFVVLTGVVPDLIKSDIDSAFRRLPIRLKDRHLIWVVVLHLGVVWASQHIGCPFGCLGSVFAWDRVGHAILVIARRMLFLPLLRYVDDYFGVSHPDCAKHTAAIFQRLVRALLGPTAINDSKTEVGKELVVLGLLVSLASQGLSISLDSIKASSWMQMLREAYETQLLPGGTAGKLAGRLNFGAQHVFLRAARCWLRPLYRQQYSPLKAGECSRELLHALRWWIAYLESSPEALILYRQPARPIRHVFSDAAGETASLCGFLFADSCWYGTHCKVPSAMLDALLPRKDEQILALEIIAVLLVLVTFPDYCADALIRFHVDSQSALGILRKGAASSSDHNFLSGIFWMLSAGLPAGVWLDWVPSHLNIADGPTRGDLSMYDRLPAQYVQPAVVALQKLAIRVAEMLAS